MITFSKTLDPSDYRLFGYYTYLFDRMIDSKIPCIVNHFHRRWEYGMALAFLESLGGPEKIKTVLDVGGAGSLFPPIAALCGYDVSLIDPSPCTSLFEEQAKILRLDSFGWSAEEFPSHRLADRYDAIVSVSTIEHVPNFAVFFEEILHRAFRAFFITTDFSMDGAQYSPDHLRTYTPRALESMNELALDMGWNESNKPDWRDTGQHVFNYNFASLGGWR